MAKGGRYYVSKSRVCVCVCVSARERKERERERERERSTVKRYERKREGKKHPKVGEWGVT